MFRERLEAVTTCVGYADFLGVVAPLNKHIFDKWVVVTSKEDVDTREVCRLNGLFCLVTDDHKRDGSFSKGRLIERGLMQLSADTWVMHIDADIVLPRDFRHSLEKAHLNRDSIYGFDRFCVKGRKDFERLKRTGWLDGVNNYAHSVGVPHGFEMGARWVGGDGWVPIGFAQLHHRIGGEEEWRGVRVKPYSSMHGSACRTDVQQSHQWDRRNRILIPEIFVAHLESDNAHTGINWNGRRSCPFVENPS